jgi:hypothetical protein
MTPPHPIQKETTMRHLPRLTAASLALAGLAVVAMGAAASAPSTTDAWPWDPSGVWNLDESVSDDLASAMADARDKVMASRGGGRGGRGRGGGMRGGPGGRGGGMGGGMRGPGGGERPTGADAPEPRDLQTGLSQLLITRLEGDLEIMDGAERVTTWTPDGRAHTERTPRGKSTRTARWDGDVLELVGSDGRLTTTRRLRLGDDGKTLSVECTLALPNGRSVSGTLVYRGT